MPLDDAIRKRDALVIPGGLLLFYSVAAIVYAEVLRPTSDFCPDGSWILINYVCYTVWKLLLPVVLIGLILVIAGASMKGQQTSAADRLHHGTPSHFVLALLISLVMVPFSMLLIQMVREAKSDTTFVIEYYDVAFKHTFLLSVATLVAALILLPYLGGYLADVRRRKRVMPVATETTKDAPKPKLPPTTTVVERAPLPHEPGYVHPDAAETDDEEWPDEAPTSFVGYAGKSRDIQAIEGIGPAYGAKLADMGIHSTTHLLAHDPMRVAAILNIGESTVTQWRAMAELMTVKGIGPQYAEALVLGGVDGVADLKKRSAASINRQVSAYLEGLDKKVIGTSITEARIAQWKEAAATMRRSKIELD